MLTQILTHLHNFFPDKTRYGTYTIADSALSVDFLTPGQYYRIQGSIFNDGVHRHPAEDLEDETFTGTVTALKIPKAVQQLSRDVAAWQEKYGDAAASPYLSEQLGEYRYSKGSTFSKAMAPATWQVAFADRLRPWRKL